MRECHREKRDVENIFHVASCASASLQRGKDFPVASKGRSVKDAVPGREDGKDAVTLDENATTKGQRRYANIGHMGPGAWKPVKHNNQKSKHNINIKFARMQLSHEEEVKTVQSSTPCGGCRQ